MTTEEQIASLLEYVKQGIDTGSEFVSSQAPLVVQEILLRGRIVETILFPVFVAIPLIGLRWIVKHQKKYCGDDPYRAFPAKLVFNWVALTLGGLLAMFSINSIVTVWLAPRVYILEQLKNLLACSGD